MSDFDVYGDEMPSVPPLDETAVEDLLAGRTNVAATGDTDLMAFVEDLRTAADGPVSQPTPQLAAFMAEGLSTENAELPAPAASTVPAPAPLAAGLPTWRKRRMTVSGLLAALGAKLAGMGMAAKAALGLGVAAMATTTAAAANVLPEPAQHAVASVVNSVSPFDVPDGESTGGVAAEEDEVDTTTTTSPSTTIPGDDDDGGTDGGETGVAANHGACVSAAAKAAPRGPGGEHGKAVSEIAKSDCGKSGGDDDGDDDGDDGGTTTTSSPTTTTPDEDELTSGSSNRGRGSGNSGQSGNSGPGGGNNGNSGSGKGR